MSQQQLSKNLSLDDVQKIIKKKSYVITARNKPDLYKLLLNNEPILRIIIHYQTGHNGLYLNGHWTGLFIDKKNKVVYFLDPLGEYPDDALLHIKPGYRFITEQDDRDINNFLDNLLRKGYKIFYNHINLQEQKEGINTCGRWVGDFLRRGISTDKYAKFIKNYTKIHGFNSDDISIINLTKNYLK